MLFSQSFLSEHVPGCTNLSSTQISQSWSACMSVFHALSLAESRLVPPVLRQENVQYYCSISRALVQVRPRLCPAAAAPDFAGTCHRFCFPDRALWQPWPSSIPAQISMQRAVKILRNYQTFCDLHPCQVCVGRQNFRCYAEASNLKVTRVQVTRDRLMDDYDVQWPQYGFASHKGYGTREHMQAIRLHGPCPIHRMTFAPLKANSSRPAPKTSRRKNGLQLPKDCAPC